MGQAKRRGTTEERQTVAINAIKAERDRINAERDRKEYERNEEVMRVWATLTPEQREQRLKAAAQDLENHQYMASIFGDDVADILHNMDDIRRNKR